MTRYRAVLRENKWCVVDQQGYLPGNLAHIKSVAVCIARQMNQDNKRFCLIRSYNHV